MPNMSYCKYHNTYYDLRDVFETIVGDEEEEEDISKEELSYKKRLIELCRNIVERVDEMEEEDDSYEEDLPEE